MPAPSLRAAVLAAAVITLGPSACDQSPEPLANREIEPAPTSADLHLRPVGDAEVVELEVGQTLAIELKSRFEWTEAAPPTRLRREDIAWSPADEAGRDRGATGSESWQVFAYRAVAPGSDDLAFNEARPWEPETITDTLTVRVIVRPAP